METGAQKCFQKQLSLKHLSKIVMPQKHPRMIIKIKSNLRKIYFLVNLQTGETALVNPE